MGNVSIPYDDFMRLVTYREINHQCRAALSYKLSARCRELYGYPPKNEGFGFDTSPLPNTALLWLADVSIGGAASPLIGVDFTYDVGLTGPNTLTAPLLTELARRLGIYEQREQRGKLRASRRTDRREVPE